MARHAARLLLFLLIQVGIYSTLRLTGESESAAEPASTALTNAANVEARLASFVKEQVRPMWETAPGVIDNALEAGPQHGLIATLVRQFLAGPDNYLRGAVDKRQRLCTTDGRRIILIGGSNVAFSIDSRLLEERYGLAPVNMGIKARLGARFMTRQVSDQIRSGDVVVVLLEHHAMYSGPDAPDRLKAAFINACPEQAAFFEEGTAVSDGGTSAPDGGASASREWDWQAIKQFSDREALAELASDCRDGANRFWARLTARPKTEAVRVASAGDHDGKDDFDRQIEPLLEAVQQRFVALNRIYARSGFNEYGDMTRHRGEPSAAPDKIHGLSLTFPQDGEARMRESAAVLNAFARRCRAAGASIYFAHPPLPRTAKTVGFAPRYEAILKDSLEFPILFPIEQSFVEIDEMYDSCYHLNWTGVTRRMAVLCEGLDRQLTPQTDLSVAQQIAARDRAVRRTILAANPESSTRRP